MLRPLTYDECLRRLDAGGVGRVAITRHAMPAVLPVNFVRRESCIVFRTDPDGMLAHGCDSKVVAFEIDGIDVSGRAGWSVLVVGTASLLTGGAAADAAGCGLSSAVTAGHDQFVAITIGQVSGPEVVDQPRSAPSLSGCTRRVEASPGKGLWSRPERDVAL
jgi:nitroimidazol reductase NimA-like FMN-containing flavoprotein (pyridoxamine 5'-phosphate oxidase superfamily)